ncbi:meprin A subunit beta-like [Chanos chanos]|uniref:Metalloendopeptidase n=1 Tax=Chanos chanos TaxID=29144 RepID=A0A6J2WCY3_CHACN|nr:meprin A subunit beta-like [Chanos chanos]
MPSQEAAYVDNGDRDIPEINKDLNLREGDILETNQRSAVLGDDYRWESPVPYVLNEDLDMNAKGVILRAFEQFRLKSCIDFKPKENEDYYISVQKDDGCYSYVGKRFTNGQILSIGAGCGTIAIVEHEFLHALGFYHEQSRYDRDEHVTIIWENILAGREHNFNKHNQSEITTQGTPYDYTSVMHYGKDGFTNGNGSTIITKLPEFQDVIGQRLDMSSYDVVELNKLYKCNASISFLDHCSFDNGSLCEMSVCSRSDHGWEKVTNVTGGPHSDHTYIGSESHGEDRFNKNSGFFMHSSTVNGQEGDAAKLETRTMTPSRDCKVQCLQFFYYHSGNDSDQLNIWIREFDSEADLNGTRRLMGQITGTPANYWQLHHVPLNATKTFQVEFESRKGAGSSTGGFSVDDINLSETECPHNTWQIRNFEELWNSSSPGTYIFSPRYYSPEGYGYQVYVRLRQEYFSIYVRLVSGDYDDQLQWPCPWRQVTFLLLDQHPHIQKRMSHQRSITTDPTYIDGGGYFWDNPRNVGTPIVENNETIYVNNGWGYRYFMYQKDLSDRAFVKGGDIFFLFSMQDISTLLQNDSLPCPSVPEQSFTRSSEEQADDGPCESNTPTYDDKGAIISAKPWQGLEIHHHDLYDQFDVFMDYVSFLECIINGFAKPQSFDNENLCEMSVCSRSDHGWERVTNVTGGPHSDHTYIGMESQAGFFMHSSTVNGQEGDTTKLETRKMTPSRDCKVQCLQFFYYHSGHESDQLNIWIREFDSEADAHGTRRLMGQITGTPANYWQLHHVPLNATKRFQMEFESRKGAGSSTGGFSVDDINLSETECPHNIWQIRNFEEIWNSSHSLKGIYSPKYYSPEGYGYQATVTFSRDVVKCYVRVVSGPYDDQLQWPCLLRQISIVLLDQNPHIEQRMSRQRSITSDGRWGNPREVGTPIGKNNNAVYATDWFYTAVYVEKKNPKDRTFVKGGEAFLFFSMKGKC